MCIFRQIKKSINFKDVISLFGGPSAVTLRTPKCYRAPVDVGSVFGILYEKKNPHPYVSVILSVLDVTASIPRQQVVYVTHFTA